MAPAKFKVISPFFLAGSDGFPLRQEPGAEVELDDPDLIMSLLNGGKIAAADHATAARIRTAGLAWTAQGPVVQNGALVRR